MKRQRIIMFMLLVAMLCAAVLGCKSKQENLGAPPRVGGDTAAPGGTVPNTEVAPGGTVPTAPDTTKEVKPGEVITPPSPDEDLGPLIRKQKEGGPAPPPPPGVTSGT